MAEHFIDETADCITDMANEMRRVAYELDLVALEVIKKRDVSAAGFAAEMIQNLIPALRLDKLVRMPIRALTWKDDAHE